MLQVKVRVGDEEKGTAAAEGLEEPGWAEVLEFAVSGEMTSDPDQEIVVRVWDHHWVSPNPCLMMFKLHQSSFKAHSATSWNMHTTSCCRTAFGLDKVLMWCVHA